jgi:signal peptidase I
MFTWRTLGLALRGAAGLLSGLAALAVLAYAAVLLLGYRPVAVYSGSMEPVAGTGSLVIERPVAGTSVRVGDVITFGNPYVSGRLVTHRVVQVVHTRDGRVGARTKGDANDHRDPWTIELPRTVGKVQLAVPYAGYALVYIRTREVRTALLGLVVLITLAGLLRRIWRTPPEPVRAARVKS